VKSGTFACCAFLLLLTAASAAPSADKSQTAGAAPAPATTPSQPETGPIDNPQAVETAQPPAGGISLADSGHAGTQASRELLVRLEVMLGRANFSPGEIDGRSGDNVRQALAAYKQAHGLSNPPAIDDATMKALTDSDKQPVLQKYTISAEDEKGPFLGTVPKDFKALSKLKYVGYANPQEMLAEKFHMNPELLRELNPKADFAKPDTVLTVADPGPGTLPPVARIEVDKGADQVRAYDQSGKVVAVFPATVGSTDRPAPSGKAVVVAVAPNPNYTYEPKRLTFGPKRAGTLKIAPGPNNPVGLTWIALNLETYGIHGTPDPSLVGKTASHGCVRLTNWDAVALGKAVKKGVPVDFVGETKPKTVEAQTTHT
jgi:lipoprotein-anchoring transpeptidase ErfK/SrfK